MPPTVPEALLPKTSDAPAPVDPETNGELLSLEETSVAALAPEVVGAPRTTWIQRLAASPGWLADKLTGHAGPMASHGGLAELDALATLAAASPRANGYLSLEPELTRWMDPQEAGCLTFARHHRAAFAVGGLHSASASDKAMSSSNTGSMVIAAYCNALRATGFRRSLFFPISEAERPTYAAANVETLMLGSEAFVDRDTWTMRGKAKADLRQMVNRGRKRHGLRTTEYDAVRAAAELAPLHGAWLEDKQSKHRMRLVVGSPGFQNPAGRRFFVAADAEGPVAFVTVTPGWAGQGWGIDVMARPDDAPAGAMDVLIVDAMAVLFDEGATLLSLGAAPMAERTAVTGHDRWLLRRVFRWLYGGRLGNRLFRFESLARYKDKYAPRWEPVYMGGWPKLSVWSLYVGCRMWGLFGAPRIDVPKPE